MFYIINFVDGKTSKDTLFLVDRIHNTYLVEVVIGDVTSR